jgi:hypothetical protein
MAPKVRLNPGPLFEFNATVLAVSAVKAVLANVCVLAVVPLPVILNAPPPRVRAELLLMMLLAGAPLAEKSSASVPLFILVAPV